MGRPKVGRVLNRAREVAKRIEDLARQTLETKNQTIEAQKQASGAAEKVETALDEVHVSLNQAAAKVVEACGSDKDTNSTAELRQMVMLTDAGNRQLAFRVKELEDVTKVMESTLNQQGVMLQRQEAINEILCNMVGISYAKVLVDAESMIQERNAH